MQLKVLLVEDSDYKRSRILDHISSTHPELVVTETRSYTSGKEAISEMKFDLLILDISLPTYDKSPTETGGRFRTFGGREIARKAIKTDSSLPIIFVTQYKSFNDKGTSYSFEALCELLAEDCGSNFCGAIFFDGGVSTWKENLAVAIHKVCQK